MYAFFDILNTKVGKLVMFKKMMLVATITSLLIPFFNNTSIVVDENFVRKYDNLSIDDSEIKHVENFSVEVVSQVKVKDFACYFDYYQINEVKGIYIADTLNEKYINNILEVKLVSNSEINYDYVNNYSLYDEPYVLETIYMENETMIKEFYVPSVREIEQILNKVSFVNPKDEIYNNLIISLNAEADFKSKQTQLTSISPFSTSITSADCDNQEILDYYFSVKDIADETISLGSTLTTTEIIQSSDDPIIHLIPKYYFQTNGVYKKMGAEWGYYIKTYNDYNDNKISSVLLYDINTIKKTRRFNHIVSITPVLSMNYKYTKDTDIVSKDVPNNYCLANPQYQMALKYVKLSGDTSDTIPLNPGDDGYDVMKDEGYSIANSLVKLIGVGKNYNSELPNIINIACILANLLVGIATSGFSLFSQIAISTATSLITDKLLESLPENLSPITIELERETEEEKTAKDDSKFIYKDFNSETENSNYQILQEENALKKYFDLQLSSYNPNNPLLFKDNTDSINYYTSFASSEDTEYVAQIANKFTANVINDNTWSFSPDPEYVDTITGEWSYLYSENFKAEDLTVFGTSSDIYVNYGPYTNQYQTVKFKATESGTYDFVLHHMLPNVSMKIENSIVTSTGKEIKVPFDFVNAKYEKSNEPYLKISKYLLKNQTYTLQIGYFFETNNFGGAKLNIYKSDLSTIQTGSSEFGQNYVYRTLTYNGNSTINEVIPTVSGQYLIAADSLVSNLDTHIIILDKNFNEILVNDNNAGLWNAYVRMTLIANNPYYVVSRYITSGSGKYKVSFAKQKYIPDINLTFSGKPILLSNFGYSNKVAYFITNQSKYNSIKFTGLWDSLYPPSNSVSFEVLNSELEQISYTPNIVNNYKTINFSRDSNYILKLTVNGSCNTNGFQLFCEVI